MDYNYMFDAIKLNTKQCRKLIKMFNSPKQMVYVEENNPNKVSAEEYFKMQSQERCI